MPIRIAVVGLGSIGRRHVRTLAFSRPEIEIVVVRRQYHQTWSEEGLVSAVAPSHEDALKFGVDAAIICSPASHHIADALAYLEVGRPVLIEKPLSTSAKLAELLTGHHSSSPQILLGYTLRHSEGMNLILEWLSSGSAGRILGGHLVARSFLPDWRPGQDYRSTVSASQELGGGVLLELSHEIDMALAFFGPFESVCARLSTSGDLDLQVEDTVRLRLGAADGVEVGVDLDFCSQISERKVYIRGEKESLSWDLLGNSVKFISPSGEYHEVILNDSREDHFKIQLEHFLECVKKSESPRVTLADGVNVLNVIDAARISSQNAIAVAL